MVSLNENVTLIIFSHTPTNISFACTVLDTFAADNINVDMISVGSPAGFNNNMAITIDDDKISDAFRAITSLREKYPDLKINISNNNSKISVSDEKMQNKPGVASKILDIADKFGSDIRLITASLIDVSILLADTNVAELYDEIAKFQI